MGIDKLIIDIGTHEAQELRVLNGNRAYLLRVYLYWWFDWCKRQVKKIIRYNGLIEYGTGSFKISPLKLELNRHLEIFSQILYPKDYLTNINVLAIDPVASITTKFLRKIKTTFQIYFLPIAVLPHNQSKDCTLTKFYIERNSLSSSLEQSNSSKELIICSAFRTKKIINALLEHEIISPDTEVILRMNCEGSEFGVIKDLVEEGFVPKLVLGSINDVRKKYGEEEAKKMLDFLNLNKIEFKYFKGSDPGTWGVAFDSLR